MYFLNDFHLISDEKTLTLHRKNKLYDIMKLLKLTFLVIVLLSLCVPANAVERRKLNFNSEWRLSVGDCKEASEAEANSNSN